MSQWQGQAQAKIIVNVTGWEPPSPDYGDEKPQHVAALLRLVLRAKSLTINTCCGVAGFSDLSSISSHSSRQIIDHYTLSIVH
jgi:hypothetical protein